MESSLFLQLKDKVPTGLQLALKKKLENTSNDKIEAISMLQLKDPIIGLILSILLGGLGIDRFYQGKILLGILKLITFGGLGIWAIIDWFLIMPSIKKDNFEKIEHFL
ncbi:TM2 domain-containing protein [Campylobacter corcagiensis]|uniref:TM2 domain-containing protein n=1 Tax=Campylobacter corcagiensis TaxID=1448857 RepID=A0A7M1LGC9_9BACT|nr:TM2 domain-containing protein [Campylobacter corcagiensis]QKF64323.1 TM2 domain-containing protein [Campylobacter corcagiensis]QOQ87490.1 TM2 domain-containing protein [Campylobacter corcagiensis]